MTPQHEVAREVARAVARELAANAAALRSLARDLVGPGHAADLVQETALRALRSPPAEPRGLAPWLATILRRLAGNHHRDARRRREREAAVAPPDVNGGPADEDLARRELLQSLTDALWRLPEPYQSALVWRYFENLTPKQIAAQKRVPIATVKSRLQRGLALLRAEFDRRDGGRWRALLPLAVAVPRTSVAVVATAAILMTPTTKVLSAAAVIVAAACLVFAWNHGEVPSARTVPEVRAPDVAGAAASLVADGSAGRRELVSDVGTEHVDLAHPHVYRLQCRVLDRDGLPVRGATIALAPRDCALADWPEPTGIDGTVEVTWRGRVPVMPVAVGLVFRGHSQALREVELRAGVPQPLVLLAEHGGGGGACAAAQRSMQADCRACHVAPMLPHVFEHPLVLADGLHPESQLADLLLAAPPGPDLVIAGFDDVTESVADVAETPPDEGRIEGRVTGDDGRPIGGTTVSFGEQPDRPKRSVRTRPDGSFEFDRVPAGVVEVRAGGGAPGLGRRTVEVFAGSLAVCDVRLARGDVLEGRVLLPEGDSPEGWRVEYVADDESWADGASVATNGAFALANLPLGTGTLLLWSSTAHRLPAAAQDNVRVGSTDLAFDLRTVGAPSGRLALRANAPASIPDGRVDVYVWQVASRRGAMAVQGPDGAFELEGLPPGFHRVAIAGVGVGWRDLGEHWVDGNAVVDLGVVPFGEPRTLRIAGRPDGETLELYLRRPDVDVRAEFAIGERAEASLPPGRWLALWGEPGDVRMREFRIGADGETVLELDASPR